MNTWLLIFYFGRGVYGPESYAYLGRFKSFQECNDMGHRVAAVMEQQERYYCIEVPKQ